MDIIFTLFYLTSYLYFIGFLVYVSFQLYNTKPNNNTIENSDDESETESNTYSTETCDNITILSEPSTPSDSPPTSQVFSEEEWGGSLRQRNLCK